MSEPILMKYGAPIYFEVIGRRYQPVNAFDGVASVDPAVRAKARVIVTIGQLGVSAAEMDLLPNLGLISTLGTGYENVDLAAAAARGIKVTHAAGANAPAVAELAIGLLIAVVRKIPTYLAAAKAGDWRGPTLGQPMITGKRMGVFGMGGIGMRVARLGEAFEMRVSYCSRTPKPDLPWPFVPTLRELAEAVDFLIITAPGGPATHHAVNADVLSALGPEGYLVNVGRGEIVDTAVLIAALDEGRIAGAALDVYEDEPEIPLALRAHENVVAAPHIGGFSKDVQIVSANLLVRNFDAFFAGEALVSPVPEMSGA